MSSQYKDLPVATGGGAGITSINGDTTAAQVIAAGDGINVSSFEGTTTITNTGGGGGGSPGGDPGSIQYNNSGSFDGFGTYSGDFVNLPSGLTIVGLICDQSNNSSIDVNNRQLTASDVTVTADWSSPDGILFPKKVSIIDNTGITNAGGYLFANSVTGTLNIQGNYDVEMPSGVIVDSSFFYCATAGTFNPIVSFASNGILNFNDVSAGTAPGFVNISPSSGEGNWVSNAKAFTVWTDSSQSNPAFSVVPNLDGEGIVTVFIGNGPGSQGRIDFGGFNVIASDNAAGINFGVGNDTGSPSTFNNLLHLVAGAPGRLVVNSANTDSAGSVLDLNNTTGSGYIQTWQNDGTTVGYVDVAGNIFTGILFDSSAFTSIDVNNKLLCTASSGAQAIDYSGTASANAFLSFDVSTGFAQFLYGIRDATGAISLRPNDRQLIAPDASTMMLDWTANNALTSSAGGWSRIVPGVIYTSTADASVANTTSELSIIGSGSGSLTIPANAFYQGQSIRIRVMGFVSYTATPTLQIKAKFNSIVLVDSGVVTLPVDLLGNCLFIGEYLITCRTGGPTGTAYAQGSFQYFTDLSVGNFLTNPSTSEEGIDTTSSIAINVTAQWGTMDAANLINGTNCTVEVLG